MAKLTYYKAECETDAYSIRKKTLKACKLELKRLLELDDEAGGRHYYGSYFDDGLVNIQKVVIECAGLFDLMEQLKDPEYDAEWDSIEKNNVFTEKNIRKVKQCI